MTNETKLPDTEKFRARDVKRLQREDARPDRREDEFMHGGKLYRILGVAVEGERVIMRCEPVRNIEEQ